MLKHSLIHPKINEIIGRAGHHGKILIADGNYPASSKKGPNAEVVSLNLMPGVVTCDQVLMAVLSAVPIEKIETMMTETSGPYALNRRPAGLGAVSANDRASRPVASAQSNRKMGVLRSGRDG